MRFFILLLFAFLLPLAAAHSQALPRVHGPGDQNWDTRFGPPAAGGLGLDNFVEAIAELPNGDLIVTGYFQNAGGDPNADYIARWDGTAWHALGTGLNGVGYTLVVAPNYDVFVGGYFTAAGGVANTGKIARWDGTAWHAVGTGIDVTGTGSSDRVSAMVILPSGELLAGGGFRNMGSNPDANFLARWDGAAWNGFAEPLNDAQVEDLVVAPNGDVVLCGVFIYGTGFPLQQYLARWNGTVWQSLGPSIDNLAFDMEFAPNGDLIMAGQFTDIGGIPGTSYVARWDGTTWHPIGPGVNNVSISLAVNRDGDILVGGTFLDAGGNPSANHIARWDGANWQNLGTGLTRPVFYSINALHVTINGDYAVGGAFTTVGDGSVPVQHFGIYHNNSVGLPEASAAPTTLRAYPNPAHGTLQVPLPAQFSGALTLLDATGRTVRSQTVMAGTAAVTMDLHGVAPGLYVLRAGAMGQCVVVE